MLIFLVIKMHIGLTRLFKDGAVTIDYDLKEKLYRKSQDLD